MQYIDNMNNTTVNTLQSPLLNPSEKEMIVGLRH